MKSIKACSAMFLLLVLTLSTLIITQPHLCQAQTKNTTHTYYFHNYQVIQKDNNGSFIVYDGADKAAVTDSGSQVTLQSQITGTRDGWSYYSAVALWVTPLQSDLHVKGTVTITAYISSDFNFTGIFNGGSYGFGLVDIDENNAEVTEFITEGPVAIGKNPFTKEPIQYSLSVNVDYIFKNEHSIGFAVGFGATVQGFDATIYFDSPSRNSCAVLPVEETLSTTPATSEQMVPEYSYSLLLPFFAIICVTTLTAAALVKLHKSNSLGG